MDDNKKGKIVDPQSMDVDRKEDVDEDLKEENIDPDKVEIEYKSEGTTEEEDDNWEEPETEEEKKLRTDEEEKMIKREFDFRTDGEVYCVDVLEKKGIAFIGDGEETLYLYDLDNKNLILKEKLHADSIAFVKISSDQKFLATAGLEGNVKIWDLEDMVNNKKLTELNKYENTESEISVKYI